MHYFDTLTLSGKTREHPTERDTKIILGINHRTLQYGYIAASDITDITEQELIDWKTTNLRPEACMLSSRTDEGTSSEEAFRSQSVGAREGKDEGYGSTSGEKAELTLWVEVEDLVRTMRRKPGIPEWRKRQLSTGELGKVKKRRRTFT
jgi:hypothetical protein